MVKNQFRHFVLSVGLSFVVLGKSHVFAEEYVSEPLRPEFMPGMTVVDEWESGCCDNVGACSGPFCDHGCRSEGIYFSAESVFVNVWQCESNGIAAEFLSLHTPAAPGIGNLEPDVDPAMRYELGYQTCDGLGVQVRYWEFDDVASMTIGQEDPADPNLVFHAWDVNVVDVEVVRKLMFKHVWDTKFSGGYRFASYEENASLRLDSTELASLDTRYIGNGFTGAAGVRRQLASRFSVIANGRMSLLLGQQTVESSISIPSHPFDNSFDARYTIESQLGATYEHPICGGGFWFARGGLEVQYWNDFVVPIGGQIEPSSTVFHGLFLAVGLER